MRQTFIDEQFERFKAPWKNFAFKSYFFWIIIGFGGIGIWLTIYEELIKSTPDFPIISKCIAATFVAIIAASLVDLNLTFNIKNIPSLIINTLTFMGMSILLLVLSFNMSGPKSLAPAILGYFLALIVWVLANSDNDKLSDDNYLQGITKKVNDLKSSVDDI